VDEYTVGEVARLARVSVRTLHHYDEIGLLTPHGRSESGYRLYSPTDLQRLQRILVYRELDFSLEEIARILADPAAELADHLRRQHRLLRERQTRTTALLRAIEREMEAHAMGMSLTPEEQFELFGTDKMDEYAKEAEQRWGSTEAFKESQRRTAAYGKDDWVEIKRQADENIEGFAAAMRAGEPPTSATAMDLAEAHRAHIGRWFYDCGYELHGCLARMYVSDERYMKSYDEIQPGFSRYVHDAILANVARAAGGSAA
jgi:MerR family transcriptional regulator, thiopeptide resistance regulator